MLAFAGDLAEIGGVELLGDGGVAYFFSRLVQHHSKVSLRKVKHAKGIGHRDIQVQQGCSQYMPSLS
jgi:hypothetical protein